MTMSATMPALKRQQGWLKQAGQFGFWFFLVKGLLWLAAPLAIYLLR